MSGAKLTFLGTGTSQGVPIIGCRCAVCGSSDPRDSRFRSSALVEYGGMKILIDAGPDFRMQMLRAGVNHLDAILLTHNHKDHTGGLDDVRSLNYIDKSAAEIYCERRVYEALKKEYGYAFAEEKYPGAPVWNIHLIDESPFSIERTEGRILEWIHDVGYRYRLADGSLVPTGNPVSDAPPVSAGTLDAASVIPIRGYHHDLPVLGFRFGDIAYITDMVRLPESEFVKLQGLRHLTLNTVGYHPHHSHFSIDEALELADKIGAEHTWLTHLSHAFPTHGRFCEDLAETCARRGIRSSVQPAYDGLTIE